MAQTMNSQWGYSVPLEESDGNARPRPSRHNTQGSQERDYRTMKSGTRRPTEYSNSTHSDSEETRQRRQSVKATHAAATRKRSRNALRDKPSKERITKVDDNSAWIHRDKLAQIEIQEMVDAGMPVRLSRRSMSAGPEVNGRSSRSMSRSRHERPDEEYEQGYEQYEGAYDNYDDFEPKRISTIQQAEEDDNAFDSAMDTDFRGASGHAMSTSPTQAGRPGTSRIPVSMASAVPVPQNVVGRDSPLPRSRHGSQAASGNWDELMYARRARSGSVGSQVLLDDERPGSSYKQQASAGRSPPKTRTASKAGSTSDRRKGSTTTARPGSSSGKKAATAQERSASRSNRRSATHSPEGDPPWVTDMYKPDPRLPADQRMLPTHAKRIAQEQWEKDGQPSTVYDRDLRPLNNTDLTPAALAARNKSTSPTSPNFADRQQAGSPTRPGTSGGYKITPTITTPPPIQRPPTAYSQHAGMSALADSQNPNSGEKDKQEGKGGCACCVVM